MKQVSKKTRTGIIDRFFMAVSELPHEISFSHKEDGWNVYKCISANWTLEIAHKTTPFVQFIRWS